MQNVVNASAVTGYFAPTHVTAITSDTARRRERAEAEQQRQQKLMDMADARRKAVAQQRDQVALIDQRVVEHFGPLKEAFVEFMASEVEPLRAENAALRQRCVELETRIDTVRDHAAQHVDARIEAEVAKRFVAGGPLSAAIDEGWQRHRADDALFAASLVNTAMGELKTKLSPLEQRVDTRDYDVDARIEAEVAKRFVAGGPLSAAIDEGWQRRRADDHEHVASLVDGTMRGLETKLGELEQRLLSHPSKLPTARAFVQDHVNYAGDIVVCDGSTYRAMRDTAAAPPHDDDWVCLARAGRDAQWPRMRGAFDSKLQYRALDVVEFDKAYYIARRDDPGPIFGDGWQALALRGKTGDKGPPGPRGERGDRRERGEIGLVGPPGPRREKGERGISGRDGIAGARGERGETGEKGNVGPSGERGAEGPPGKDGKLPIATPFEPDKVYYAGDVVVCDGSTYQAVRDTGQGVTHTDWICLARAGYNGISPTIRGTYNVNEIYARLDVVAFDGAAFIARRDDPGICPGDGWQTLSRPGRRGENGERGLRGEKGDSGERGEPGTTIVDWIIDREGYAASPRMSDGTVGPMLELRELFEQFQWETS